MIIIGEKSWKPIWWMEPILKKQAHRNDLKRTEMGRYGSKRIKPQKEAALQRFMEGMNIRLWFPD